MKTLRNLFYGVPVGLLCVVGWTLSALVFGLDWVSGKLLDVHEWLVEEWDK